MKKHIDVVLPQARPDGSQGNAQFITDTMAAVRLAQNRRSFSNVLHRMIKPGFKRNYFGRLKTLSPAMLVALVLCAAVLLSGTTYAAIRYVPALLHITGKSITQRGTTLYTIPGFADCIGKGQQSVQQFELNKSAPPTSDDEVQKIVQARCESGPALLDAFVRKAWPTYGSHSKWQDGDTIYYASPYSLGTVQSVSANYVTLTYSGSNSSQTFTVPAGQKLNVYSAGVKSSLAQIKKGDTVFAVVRLSDIYHQIPSLTQKSPGVAYFKPSPDQQPPKVIGLIGLIKLSLPYDYYLIKQTYLSELQSCMGNPGEYCATGSGQIDIFPREGGEGASNPELQRSADSTQRIITGKVTALGANTLTLKSSSGASYSVTAPESAFSDYNTTYAPQYDAYGTLQIGTTVSVTYFQPKDANSHVITPSQIFNIGLLLDGNPKSNKPVEQY